LKILAGKSLLAMASLVVAKAQQQNIHVKDDDGQKQL
jgi:hypothetical protein